MTTAAPGPPLSAQSKEPWRVSFVRKFTVLQGAPRELWIVFLVKLLTYAAYQVTNLGLVLWLSWDFHYSDQKALGLVFAWSLSMTVFTLMVGSLTDVLGLRRTFFFGAWVCIIARTVMVFAHAPGVALVFGLLPLAFGEALGTPVLVAAVRHYSNTRQRSISFSMAYALMNAGSVLAVALFDFVRGPGGVGEHGSWTLAGISISSYRTLFLFSLLLEFSILPLLYFLRPGLEVTDEGVRIVPRTLWQRHGSVWESAWHTVRSSLAEALRLFAALLRQKGFHRLLAFLILIAFLKLIFMQMYYVYPTFGIRELGKGAPVGHLWGINGLLVILLVPVVGALTQRFSAYAMVIVGGVISAASVFIMALPTSWFVPLANSPAAHSLAQSFLGLTGSVHPYYVMITLFVVLLSVGEAFYSPRVYEYAAAIAPKGQEASYGALSYVPFLLAKLLVGAFSGMLLARYCPAQGARHSGTMWLFVALTATIAPVGLLVFRRLIRVHEAGRET